MMTIGVTGATGFVGRFLCRVLDERGCSVAALVRGVGTAPSGAARELVVGDLAERPSLTGALRGIDIVVHLAGRAHVLKESAADPRQAYMRANAHATAHLASEAAAAGVRRLVFVSSVKVNGERTFERPFVETDPPAPEDDYGRSKLAAEQALYRIAADTGLEVVVIRPPLIYGPGVQANYLRLIRLADRGLPLPLGSVRNRRSMVSLWNLCGLIAAAAEQPAAAGETFLVSDQQDLSTPELIETLAAALGKPSRLLPFPVALLAVLGRASGQSGTVERLTGSLQVDSGKATRLLGWHPSVSVREGIARTVDWYRAPSR
jgi:nucleoside-diphosphate-sugar epimerase